MNAWSEARHISEGCQHGLGCKCDPPFWLRPAPPEEVALSPYGMAAEVRRLREESESEPNSKA